MGTIPERGLKIKNWAEDMLGEWGVPAIVFLAVISSFGLGRLSALEDARAPVSIAVAPANDAPAALFMGGLIVASRTGSVYYFPWCAGAQRIAPANQVWFSSESAALQAGYAPAKACKGLQ